MIHVDVNVLYSNLMNQRTFDSDSDFAFTTFLCDHFNINTEITKLLLENALIKAKLFRHYHRVLDCFYHTNCTMFLVVNILNNSYLTVLCPLLYMQRANHYTRCQKNHKLYRKLPRKIETLRSVEATTTNLSRDTFLFSWEYTLRQGGTITSPITPCTCQTHTVCRNRRERQRTWTSQTRNIVPGALNLARSRYYRKLSHGKVSYSSDASFGVYKEVDKILIGLL